MIVTYEDEGVMERDGLKIEIVPVWKWVLNGVTKAAENGGYPPTQNGDIRSLFWLFSLMALQN